MTEISKEQRDEWRRLAKELIEWGDCPNTELAEVVPLLLDAYEQQEALLTQARKVLEQFADGSKWMLYLGVGAYPEWRGFSDPWDVAEAALAKLQEQQP